MFQERIKGEDGLSYQIVDFLEEFLKGKYDLEIIGEIRRRVGTEFAQPPKYRAQDRPTVVNSIIFAIPDQISLDRFERGALEKELQKHTGRIIELFYRAVRGE
ncbi:MAG: hypothetical protein GF381_01205 [Candidatus Pacebacteria bacterium]|nr:hypothetical protein [Candidatus Paceibacterota bacterium]